MTKIEATEMVRDIFERVTLFFFATFFLAVIIIAAGFVFLPDIFLSDAGGKATEDNGMAPLGIVLLLAFCTYNLYLSANLCVHKYKKAEESQEEQKEFSEETE